MEKIRNKVKPSPPIIILFDDQEPTEKQLLEMAEAEAAGLQPLIVNLVAASKPNQAAQD